MVDKPYSQIPVRTETFDKLRHRKRKLEILKRESITWDVFLLTATKG